MALILSCCTGPFGPFCSFDFEFRFRVQVNGRFLGKNRKKRLLNKLKKIKISRKSGYFLRTIFEYFIKKFYQTTFLTKCSNRHNFPSPNFCSDTSILDFTNKKGPSKNWRSTDAVLFLPGFLPGLGFL